MNSVQNKFHTVFFILGLIVLMSALCWLLGTVHMITNILVISILVSYLIAPGVHFLSKKGVSTPLAIAVVYVLIAALTALFVSYLWPVVDTEFRRLLSNLNGMAANLHNITKDWVVTVQSWLPQSLKHFADPDKLNAQKMMTYLQKETPQLVSNTMPGLIQGVRGMASIATGAIIVPLIVFYILMDTKVYKEGFIGCLPKSWRRNGIDLLRRIDYVLGKFIRGQLIVCVTIGFFVGLALWLLGIDYALLIGVFSGIVDVIPYVGVGISYIPAFIIALLNKGPIFAIVTILILQAVHWLEGHIIVPAVIGRSVNLPPLTVMAALIAGAELGGIMGMLLAIPITAIIRVILEFYVEKHPDFGPLTEEDMAAPETPYPAAAGTVSPKESVKSLVDKVQNFKNKHILKRSIKNEKGQTIIEEYYTEDSAELKAVKDIKEPETESKVKEDKSENK